MQTLVNKLGVYLKLNDSSRTANIKRNIAALFGFHSFNLLLSLGLVPLTLRCLSTYEYGIWLTLSSITTWFISLDFGLGNGLRNKLTEALSTNKIELARIYISTTYFYLSIISIIFLAIYSVINPFLSWHKILNIGVALETNINIIVYIVFFFFIINFVLKIITYVTSADQKPAMNGFFTFIINILMVALIYLLSISPYKSLFNVGLIYSAVPSIVLCAVTVLLFSKRYSKIKPSLKFVKAKYSKDLVGLGFQFFIIQIASLIVFTTDNLIISQIFTPSDVTYYNIAYKYFNIIPLVFGVILNPFWSAYTEAYINKDYTWIKTNTKKLIKIWALFFIVIVIMFFSAGFVYKKWIGQNIEIPMLLSLFMALFAIISMWNNIFAYFLNGIGKIRLQLFSAIFVGIINIPLSIILAKNYGLGSAGVILATCICLLVGSVWAPVQYLKIVRNNATGIWDR